MDIKVKMKHIKKFKIFEKVNLEHEELVIQYVNDVLMDLRDDGLDCCVIEDPLESNRNERCEIHIEHEDDDIDFSRYESTFKHIDSYLISEGFELYSIQLYDVESDWLSTDRAFEIEKFFKLISTNRYNRIIIKYYLD